jgi:hypothetical protein
VFNPTESEVMQNAIQVGSQPEASASGSVADAASASAGAPPSNTAPANGNSDGNNPDTKIVGAGIDSLYLSFPGKLNAGVQSLLDRLKDQAQSRDPDLRSLAQYTVGDWIFEVSDKGARYFSYVLTDSRFRMEISRSSAESMPMAHVQVSSVALASIGVFSAVAELNLILSKMGELAGEPTVSRADLFVDSVTVHDLTQVEDCQWVTRARSVARYTQEGRRSGYVVGRGGDLLLRLYDKTLEVTRSGKNHAERSWKQSGWDGTSVVWRTEMQFRRNALRSSGISTVGQLMAACGGLWHYSLEEWCRLSIPDPSDSKRSRWITHPFWNAIIGVDDFRRYSKIKRTSIRRGRAPSGKWFVDYFVGVLTSFMAVYEITNTAWALQDLVDLANIVLRERARHGGVEVPRLISQKVAQKTRGYGIGPAFRVPHLIPLQLELTPRQSQFGYYHDEDEK